MKTLVTVNSADLTYLRAVVAVTALAVMNLAVMALAVMMLRREMLLRDVILVLVAVTLVTDISPDLTYLTVVAVMAL